ncbi:MAG: hypothetical protein M1344_00530 [Candidatus Thermoplasmatota archaeon]|jgi:pimeloyl-ACP methyl ester carboxylesterase|nr:hypothetical protein [Candidatus Thermoplasmatota archaeon]
MYGTEEKKVMTSSGEISATVRNAGNGLESVVFLAGLSGWRRYWKSIIHKDLLRNFTLIAIDLPGQGDSVTHEDYTFEIESQAAF